MESYSRFLVLALALLVPGVYANHPYNAFALDDLAFIADFFY